MSLSGAFTQKMMTSDVIYFGSAILLMLAANYALERESRLGYLLALRSRLLNEQLDLNTKIEPLTGLWNRRYLSECMERAWADPDSSRMMAVILLDLDHFKMFNDTCGHLEGDVCLQRAARALSGVLEDSPGIAVRFGGEEFLIFVPGLDAAGALTLAARLRAAIQREAIGHPALGGGAFVTASYGVATGVASMTTPSALIAAADKALYRAKEEGRDCIRVQMASSRIAA
jgi:diguanylate cyclase (GGDEF)-like protein